MSSISSISSVSAAISPVSQRAALDALEAQRAAYRRFARDAAAQHGPATSGDFDQVAEYTASVAQDVAALHDGTQAVRATVDTAAAQASESELRELERRMHDMMREARKAETAIHNLTSQLEAWRDAYGRQLSDAGIVPGSGTTDDGADGGAPYAAKSALPPRILDRRG